MTEEEKDLIRAAHGDPNAKVFMLSWWVVAGIFLAYTLAWLVLGVWLGKSF